MVDWVRIRRGIVTRRWGLFRGCFIIIGFSLSGLKVVYSILGWLDDFYRTLWVRPSLLRLTRVEANVDS